MFGDCLRLGGSPVLSLVHLEIQFSRLIFLYFDDVIKLSRYKIVKSFTVFLDPKPLGFQIIFFSRLNIQKEFSLKFLLSIISTKLLNFSQSYSIFFRMGHG